MKRSLSGRVIFILRLAVAFTFSVFCQDVGAESLIVPNDAANSQINYSADGMFADVTRAQTVYGASQFPSYPIIISQIQWRPDVYTGGPITSGVISNIHINLSTTTNSADHLSLDFAQNVGGDETTAFFGDLILGTSLTVLSNGTTAFDINIPLQTPFVYDPSKGNLLIDVRNFSGCTANIYDNSTSSGSDTVSRVFSSDASAITAASSDSGGGPIQITYSSGLVPPTIAIQPTNQLVSIGSSVTFSVSAVGLPDLSYQWFFNDIDHPVINGTNKMLILADVQISKAGSYFIQVSNRFGTILSSNALLTVSSVPIIVSQPVDQVVSAGAAVVFAVEVQSGLPPHYQWFFNTTNELLDATNASLILDKVQVTQTGFYSVRIDNGLGLTNSVAANLRIGLVVPSRAVDGQVDNNAEATFVNVLREQTVYGVSDFPSYPIAIEELRWRPDAITGGPATDSIPNLQISLSTTTNAADHLSEVFAENIGADEATVFNGTMTAVTAFLASSNGTKVFDIKLPLQAPFVFDPSKGNLLVDLRNFSGGSAYLFNNSSGATPDAVSRIFNDGNPTATSATGADSGGGPLQVVYSAVRTPPSVRLKLASQTVAVGGDASLMAVVSGVPTFSYQWFFNDFDHPIDSATNSSLILTNAQINQAGNYFVQVSNAFGSAVSSSALLTVVVMPLLVFQPVNQTVIIGGMATFSVAAQSAFPLSFQWFFNSTNAIVGETNSTLVVTNVQANMAGFYSVQVANKYGSVVSSNANLSIGIVIPNYATSYQVSNNAESLFVNALREQTVYGASQFPPYPILIAELRWRPDPIVGRALTNSVSNLQINLSTTGSNADHLSSTFSSNIGPDDIAVFSGPALLSTSFSTLANGTKAFDIALPLQTPFVFDSSRGNLLVDIRDFSGGQANFYNNTVSTSTDTVSRVYSSGNPNAAVSSGADTGGGALQVIYSLVPWPPVISIQPTNLSAVVGGVVTFNVIAGPSPLSYQWFFNTNNLILGATNSSLVLTNIHMSQAGTYSVAVSNPYGTTNSAFALLTVNFPPANIFLGNTNVMGGGSFDVPVFLAANGNENTLSFSLNFPTQQMAYAGITLGSGALDAGFLPNTSQTAGGRVGVTLQLPPGETFAPGTQEVVRVSFLSAVVTGAQVAAPVNFTNQPINRLLFDSQGVKLATNFINGSVTLTTTDFEGDVTPRPVGDRSLDIFDWSQVGRFVAGLDSISNATEFQRADCAPKTTGGDGQLKVTDWVQAGRYGAAIDSMSVVGGPSAPVTPTILTGGPRTLSISAGTAVKGLNLTTPIILQSQGNENAVGFSVNFNPAVLKYLGTIKGGAATSATLNINSNQVASGVLGVALALPAGNSFASGQQEVAKINFAALVSTTNTAVTLSDSPVLRSISDPVANELSANYSNLSLSVNPPPALSISSVDTNALLAWPVWATGFNLQGAGSPSSPWTNVSGGTQTNSSNISITVPMPYSTGYFRLLHP